MVEDVIKDSPADNAGLKIGDELIGVGSNFTQNVQAYKQALQAPNQRVKLVIRRDHELQTITINIASIL